MEVLLKGQDAAPDATDRGAQQMVGKHWHGTDTVLFNGHSTSFVYFESAEIDWVFAAETAVATLIHDAIQVGNRKREKVAVP